MVDLGGEMYKIVCKHAILYISPPKTTPIIARAENNFKSSVENSSK